jgi:FkbM family methyltransferase
MNWRTLRRKLTPTWLQTDTRRRGRDILLRRFGVARCHTPPILAHEPDLLVRSWLPFVLANELLCNASPTFLQIGAFDGVGDDDFRELIVRHRLRGVLVEPQPGAFAKLQETYANQRQVTLLQAAIGECEGQRELYVRRDTTSMAASFDRGHLRRHGIPDAEITTISVPCHTVASALAAADMENVDILQVDAEGYDWPIIRSLDFARIRPAVIRFEYRNMRHSDADECLRHLSSQGYRFLLEPRDIIAVREREAAGELENARVA